MIADTEPAAFGFLDSVEKERDEWCAHTAIAFRAQSVWVFGVPEAELCGVQIGATEQLVCPIPFVQLYRLGFSVADVRTLLGRSFHGDLMNVANWPCPRALIMSPRLLFKTQAPGELLRIRTTGLVQGVLLVGEQLKL